ncbi:apolipoprotein L2 isoform X2 [Bubalus bubalis]|uniref:apolipoprotein L2 isoform X2 n=1 Tax=Bubalus bubalis TaxID=89462 RepID=UPI001E1B7D8C|nr:apolipoprotein L2 isoform X2 [Bubalus bubalis]
MSSLASRPDAGATWPGRVTPRSGCPQRTPSSGEEASSSSSSSCGVRGRLVQSISRHRGCVWSLQRCTAGGCICTAENVWILFTLSQRKTPGEDVDELHNYLNELKRALVEDDKERLSKEQLDRRRFLNKFRRVKWQLEECISKFHELADKVEKVHKGCTISNVLVHSTGAVSGILTIVGLALAPVTMGASVVLLATGIGLGAAATVTSVSTSIIEHVNRSSAETEASRMMSTFMKKWKVLLEVLKSIPTTEKVTKAVQCIEIHIHAIETGQAIPGSAANANIGVNAGRISYPAIKQIETGFKATALTITKGARIGGLATAGVFLLVDVGFMVKESMHLHDGAKTEAAESLRRQAWELERKLEELTQIYESLQEDLI